MKKYATIICITLVLLVLIYRTIIHAYLPEDNSSKVIIYTTDWCPYCVALRKTLNQYEIPYKDYNTETTLSGLLGYLIIGGHGVPVTVIGNRVLHGYDGQELTDALVEAGHEIPAVW